MVDSGFIVLHRKLINSQVWLNDGLLKLFLWCLLKANHKDKWVPVNTGRGSSQVKIKRGQFLFGRKTAAKELKMKPATVYSRMQKLQNMQNISMQSSSHYSVVTVCNYNSYQNAKNRVQHANQQASSRQVAGNQQASSTTNNDNNVNNDNNDNKNIVLAGEKIGFSYETRKFTGVTKTDIAEWSEAYPAVNIITEMRAAAQWLISNATKRKKNVRRFLTNWFTRSQEKGGNNGLYRRPTTTNNQRQTNGNGSADRDDDLTNQKSEIGSAIEV